MKQSVIFRIIIALCAGLVLHACATTTLTSVRQNESYQGGPLSRILIIGVDQNLHMKRLLENEFARQLKDRGVEAVPSYAVLPEDTVLSRDMIDAKMKELKMDAVLITTLLEAKDIEAYTSPTFVSTGGFYSYYMECCYSVTSGYDVEIETRIFDAKNDTLIWAAFSTTALERVPEKTIQSYVSSILRDLQGRRLLK